MKYPVDNTIAFSVIIALLPMSFIPLRDTLFFVIDLLRLDILVLKAVDDVAGREQEN